MVYLSGVSVYAKIVPKENRMIDDIEGFRYVSSRVEFDGVHILLLVFLIPSSQVSQKNLIL